MEHTVQPDRNFSSDMAICEQAINAVMRNREMSNKQKGWSLKNDSDILDLYRRLWMRIDIWANDEAVPCIPPPINSGKSATRLLQYRKPKTNMLRAARLFRHRFYQRLHAPAHQSNLY
jgi:hypothetical protein